VIRKKEYQKKLEKLADRLYRLEREYQFLSGKIQGVQASISMNNSTHHQRLNVHQSLIDTILFHLKIKDEDE
jgi:hypothetical protein